MSMPNKTTSYVNGNIMLARSLTTNASVSDSNFVDTVIIYSEQTFSKRVLLIRVYI